MTVPNIVQAMIFLGCTQVAASKNVSAASCFSSNVHTTPYSNNLHKKYTDFCYHLN